MLKKLLFYGDVVRRGDRKRALWLRKALSDWKIELGRRAKLQLFDAKAEVIPSPNVNPSLL